jgi:hypothetical protein
MGYIGLCSPGNDECFVIQLDMHNIRMSMYVFVYDGDNKIHLKLILPCVAERYTAPIIGLYLALANKDKALSHLHFDLYNGVLSFEYTYFAHPGCFNSDYFQKSFRSITSEAHLNYTRLNHMCSGFLNTKDKQACIALFKSSIEKLNSKTIQDHTEYGEKLSSLFSQITD